MLVPIQIQDQCCLCRPLYRHPWFVEWTDQTDGFDHLVFIKQDIVLLNGDQQLLSYVLILKEKLWILMVYSLFLLIVTYKRCRIFSHIYNSLLLQYIPRNMHTVFALLSFVVVIHWLISPYPSGLLHWHCGNLTIAPVQAKQLWWIWINTSCEFIMNDCITTTKQSTTKPCAYFLGYTVYMVKCMQFVRPNIITSFQIVYAQEAPSPLLDLILIFPCRWF